VFDDNFILLIANELGLEVVVVKNTIKLLSSGSSIPFISRYRKDLILGIDEIKVGLIAQRFDYYQNLIQRRETIISSITEQGKLTEELSQKINSCFDRQQLEDIYLPYKPKRKTRASVAKEKGLTELAQIIFSQEYSGDKASLVSKYINSEKGVEDFSQALNGALDIIAEWISEDFNVRGELRELFWEKGVLEAKVKNSLKDQQTKFRDYYNFSEKIKNIFSHRLLAIRRGSKESILLWKVLVPDSEALGLIRQKVIKGKSLFYEELLRAIEDSYKRLIHSSLEAEIFTAKLKDAEQEAIGVFSKNLRHLLLMPPAKGKVILGVDPGFKSGCKLAVIDAQGNFKKYLQIFLDIKEAFKLEQIKKIISLIKEYGVEIVAIGNGTASKEAFLFIMSMLKENNLNLPCMVVSEAGASVYSASSLAQKEFPDLDLTIRGAISIARRLQDPLSELVKIDPKAIGVGQYQHDVNQVDLKKALDLVVESCVDYVGVDLNTASLELLSRVSGVNSLTAKRIIEYRLNNKGFIDKSQLLQVWGIKEKSYEQAAGFLRIIEGKNPLDNSAIHPESYPIVEKMALDVNADLKSLIGNEKLISQIDTNKYKNDVLGEYYLKDIIQELKKPGIDPRQDFTSIVFDSNINSIDDLKENMVFLGVITNVTNFGAFVDIGVHLDGLLHISKMSKSFVKSPYDLVSVGDKVKVKVISIDKDLSRIGLELINDQIK